MKRSELKKERHELEAGHAVPVAWSLLEVGFPVPLIRKTHVTRYDWLDGQTIWPVEDLMGGIGAPDRTRML